MPITFNLRVKPTVIVKTPRFNIVGSNPKSADRRKNCSTTPDGSNSPSISPNVVPMTAPRKIIKIINANEHFLIMITCYSGYFQISRLNLIKYMKIITEIQLLFFVNVYSANVSRFSLTENMKFVKNYLFKRALLRISS